MSVQCSSVQFCRFARLKVWFPFYANDANDATAKTQG